jgi:hypothetical protein
MPKFCQPPVRVFIFNINPSRRIFVYWQMALSLVKYAHYERKAVMNSDNKENF